MEIGVVSYNMSWATQINKALGSEADFVKECKSLYKRGGIQCTDNAVKQIGELKNIHLMGIQEVNSDIEMKLKKVQPLLKSYERGDILNSQGNTVSVSILFNPKIFGKVIKKYVFNLSNRKDTRPCLMIYTENNFLLINLHSPWENEKLPEILSKKLSGNNPIAKHIHDNTKIIVMGDFNDDKCLLTKSKPLIIHIKDKKIIVKHNKTKKQLQTEIKSCCWHEKDHKYGHFDSPGDYILTNKHVKQLSMFIPPNFNKIQRKKTLFSDHKPVMSIIKI